MSIANKYNQTAVTYRETAVGQSTIKKAYTVFLTSFACHVQPLDSTLAQSLPGSFGKQWMMFCPVADIKEGDKVLVGGTDEYRVTGVEKYSFSFNPHMEISMKAFRE